MFAPIAARFVLVDTAGWFWIRTAGAPRDGGRVPGAAAGLAEDALGLELGVRVLAGRAEFRVRLAAPLGDSGLFFPLYGIFAHTSFPRSPCRPA